MIKLNGYLDKKGEGSQQLITITIPTFLLFSTGLGRRPHLAGMTTPRLEFWNIAMAALFTQSSIQKPIDGRNQPSTFSMLNMNFHPDSQIPSHLSHLCNPPSLPRVLFMQFSCPHSLVLMKEINLIIWYQSITSQKVTGPEKIGVSLERHHLIFFAYKCAIH